MKDYFKILNIAIGTDVLLPIALTGLPLERGGQHRRNKHFDTNLYARMYQNQDILTKIMDDEEFSEVVKTLTLKRCMRDCGRRYNGF